MTAEEELALDIARDLVADCEFLYVHEAAYERGLNADLVADALKRVVVTL